jgi:tRNA pseudouridine55 synthase
VDKPAGPSSHDVVARVRRVYRTRAVGHAGTLDPFATGLLVVLLGRATRLARFVERQAKGYLAEAVLGVVTDTDDATGRPFGGRAPPEWPPVEGVRAALEAFVGTHAQRPPAYSAKHVGGQRSHALARRGEAVPLQPVPVTVHAAELVGWEPPLLVFRAEVSAGTYLRALARDLGERLGTGAHLRALRREWIGPLHVREAVPLDRLGPDTPLLPPLAVVAHLPVLELDAVQSADVRHGRLLTASDAAPGCAALIHEGRLVAVADGVAGGWQPRVVLEDA